MKKLSTLLLAIVLLLTVIVGGTMAYFTDSVETTSVVVSGNIDILEHEQERVKDASGAYTGALQNYTQGKTLAPFVQSGAAGFDTVNVGGHGVQLRSADAKNYVDKLVTVENVGVNPAYVRTYIAVPTAGYKNADPAGENWIHWDGNAGESLWSWQDGDGAWCLIDDEIISGVEYDIYVATYCQMLQPGQTTSPSLLGFYLDPAVNHDGVDYFFTTAAGEKITLGDLSGLEILVATEAVQTTTFTDPWTALDTAFGAPAGDNHPWENANTTYVSSQAELDAALSADSLNAGDTIRLTAGSYTLPAQLPTGVRFVGHEDGVVLTAPAAMTGKEMEFYHVTFANDVDFTGCGQFDRVVFQGAFTAVFNNPAFFTDCVFVSAPSYRAEESVREHEVLFVNCTDAEGEPVE